MTRALFVCCGKHFTAVTVSGHATQTARAGEDIVCAAVSSAVYLTANTITDVLGADAAISMRDGFFSLKLRQQNAEAQNLLKGLALHLKQLSEQYPRQVAVKLIQLSYSEVCSNA